MKLVNHSALLCAALLLVSCGQASKAGSAGITSLEKIATEAPSTIYAVTTTEAVRGQIRDYLSLSGDVVAGTTVDAYSDVAGKVTKLFVTVGQKVQKDEPLAEVDPSRPGMSFVPGVVKAPISGTIVALPAQLGMTIAQTVPVARIAGSGSLEARIFVAERFISKMKINLPVELIFDAYPGRTFYGR
ncbi:MAG: HlyD family efflux transporter periplasmic adaptor subunit, partial [Termitinemataceae bacterium]